MLNKKITLIGLSLILNAACLTSCNFEMEIEGKGNPTAYNSIPDWFDPSGMSGSGSTCEDENDTTIYYRTLYADTKPKSQYNLNENLDLSALTVSQRGFNKCGKLVESLPCNDYVLTDNDSNESVTDGMTLTKAGTFTVNISKDGYRSTSFDYKVIDNVITNHQLKVTKNLINLHIN